MVYFIKEPMDDFSTLASRKSDHIRINLDKDVQSSITTGLERYRLVHNALPEVSLEKVDTQVNWFGKTVQSPILISSMTGGTPRAGEINMRLAEAAQWAGIAMGLGSQRVSLERRETLPTFQVRKVAPGILLFANIGAIQLNHNYGVDDCRRLIDSVEADALILHLNPLQEALQVDGDTNFDGLLQKIEAVCQSLGVPVVIKEVGWGISAAVARRLVDCGIAAIDVAGAGGTSWSLVEMHRMTDPMMRRVAELFSNWGIPTAEAVRQVRAAVPEIPVIASGGLRNGIELAKCLALGARLGGFAGPFLKAADQGLEEVQGLIEEIRTTLRIAMFSVGAASIDGMDSTKITPV